MELSADVPKTLAENITYRAKLRKAASRSAALRREIIDKCRGDILYFLNAWCYLHEPRPRRGTDGRILPDIIPFITWPHQDPIIRTIREKLGFESVGVEKSRGEGMSWIAVYMVLHDCIFAVPGFGMPSIGIVSRNMETGDVVTDMGSLGAKADFALKQLPEWMVGKEYLAKQLPPPGKIGWRRSATNHTWKFLHNGAEISIYAATANVGSGGRYRYFVAQPVSSLIVTPYGWRRMGDLVPGDMVSGSDGLPHRVRSVLCHGEKDVFRLTFSDGQTARCCDDHLWAVQTTGVRHSKYEVTSPRRNRWNGTPGRDRFERIPLHQILPDYKQKNGKWFKAKYHIPMTKPVVYDPVTLPLHPYLVGVWLGDGYAAQKGTLLLASDDDYIVNRVRSMLPPGVELARKKPQVYIARRIGRGGKKNDLKTQFRNLDMLRQGVNKKIPEIYLRGTPEERLELIRGLMDTDGATQGKPGRPSSYCSYSTISESLKNGMVELVQSLGGYCKVHLYKTTCTSNGKRVNGKDCYRVGIALPPETCPFSLPRKVDRHKDRSKYLPTRTIIDIRPDGQEECRCITVDSDDHLYLTDGFVVTSNCDELSKFPRYQDEAALTSTQGATDSLFIIGTPLGSIGAYYQVMHEPSNMTKLVLAWEDNPTRNRGLYRVVNGKPVAVDPLNNPLPPHYDPPNRETLDLFSRLRHKGFQLEKSRVRSPWYDGKCDDPLATPFTIAQEYDRDYGGSAYQIFGEEFFKEANAGTRPPFCRVNVDYDEAMEPTVTRADDGLLHLWMTLDPNNRPPKHSFVVSVDICTGLGGAYTSNSVLEIIDTVTMEQVGELASNSIIPTDFADLSVAICKWLGDAYLAWERNGPGHGYGAQVRHIGYGNIYYHGRIFEKRKKKTRIAGWWTDQKTKEVLFMEFQRIITAGELKLHSDPLVKECHKYVRVGRSIEHEATVRGDEGPDVGTGHGDRVIALGVGVQAMQDRPANITRHAAPPPGSVEALDQEYQESLQRVSDDWDERSNWDLMRGRRAGSIG